MPIENITAEQFETQLADGVLDRDEAADVTLGPIKDLHIRPQSRVFESQNDRIRQVFDLVALVSSGNYTNADLDAFVENEGMERRSGSKATATLIFSRATVPGSDITIEAGFPIATEPDQVTGRTVTFVTIAPVTFSVAVAGSYLNEDTQRYEIEAQARALSVGSLGRVGANRIKVPRRNLADFDEVFNRVASAGGFDEETNNQLIRRYLLAVLGTDISTADGLIRRILDNFTDVEDAVVAFGNDVELERAGSDAGAVDAHIVGDVLDLVTAEPVVFSGVGNVIVLSKQPVTTVSTVNEGGTVFVEGTYYEVVLDATGVSRSTRAQSGIRFLPGAATLPSAVGAAITVTYLYDSLIEALQAFFEQTRNFVFGRDLLFRKAEEVGIVLNASLTVLSGYNPAAVRDVVLTIISDYINALLAGHDVEEFDIDREVSKVTGVDNFIYNQLSRVGGSGVQDVAIAKTEYARITSSNLIVTPV